MTLADDIRNAIDETRTQPRGAARTRVEAWGAVALDALANGNETNARQACRMAALVCIADLPAVAAAWRLVLLDNPR